MTTNLSKAFFISLLGPILGKPMVLVVMLELDILQPASDISGSAGETIVSPGPPQRVYHGADSKKLTVEGMQASSQEGTGCQEGWCANLLRAAAYIIMRDKGSGDVMIVARGDPAISKAWKPG